MASLVCSFTEFSKGYLTGVIHSLHAMGAYEENHRNRKFGTCTLAVEKLLRPLIHHIPHTTHALLVWDVVNQKSTFSPSKSCLPYHPSHQLVGFWFPLGEHHGFFKTWMPDGHIWIHFLRRVDSFHWEI